MASLFWVGGTNTMNGVNLVLATSSGGTATAASPSAADSVTFDGNSGAGTATIAIDPNCASWTLALGYTGTVTLTHAMTVSGSVTLTQGTLNTNGQTCSWGSFSTVGSNGKTLTLGASAVSVTTSSDPAFSANFVTWTANTATITFSGSNAHTVFGVTNLNGTSLVYTGSGTIQFDTGAITCANLTFTGTASTTGAVKFLSGGTVTVTGTVTATGNSATNRLLIFNGTLGTAQTISAATVSLTNVDFQDITGSGAATWSGASVGDCQGNSGITFTTPVTRYAVAAGNWSSTGMWSTSSGGATGASVPLPQDTVILDGSSGAGTYTVDMPRLGKDITCTGFTRTLALTSLATEMFGNLTLGSGMTYTANKLLVFGGRSSQTITSAGVAFTNNLQIQAPGGTYTLQDDLSAGNSGSLVLGNGTFNANSHNVTLSAFGSAVAQVRTIHMGSGTWTLGGTGTVWDTSTTTGLTFDAGTSTIVFSEASSAAKTFAGGGLTYGTFRHAAAGAASLTITGSNTFANLDLECTTARTVTLPANGLQAVSGTLTLSGAAGQLLSLVSSSPGVATTVVMATIVGEFDVSISTDVSISGLAGTYWVNTGGTDAAYIPQSALKAWWSAGGRRHKGYLVKVNISNTVKKILVGFVGGN